jgi:hypothetical protein
LELQTRGVGQLRLLGGAQEYLAHLFRDGRHGGVCGLEGEQLAPPAVEHAKTQGRRAGDRA